MKTTGIEFINEDGSRMSIEDTIETAIIAASSCWEFVSQAGKFQEDRANAIRDAVLRRLEEDDVIAPIILCAWCVLEGREDPFADWKIVVKDMEIGSYACNKHVGYELRQYYPAKLQFEVRSVKSTGEERKPL